MHFKKFDCCCQQFISYRSSLLTRGPLGHVVDAGITCFGGSDVPNFRGVAGSEDFACVTLPTTLLDFQGKIDNFCNPTLLKIRFKIPVNPSIPPPPKKKDTVKIDMLQ